MVRHHDWPERLAELLDARRTVPFSWAENNCGLFAADCIQAMTGTDLGQEFRGRCATKADAIAAIHQRGENLETLAENIMSVHGFAAIPVLAAQRGDLVFIELEGRPSLGIANGAQALYSSPSGLVAIPLRAAKRAWRIQ